MGIISDTIKNHIKYGIYTDMDDKDLLAMSFDDRLRLLSEVHFDGYQSGVEDGYAQCKEEHDYDYEDED